MSLRVTGGYDSCWIKVIGVQCSGGYGFAHLLRGVLTSRMFRHRNFFQIAIYLAAAVILFSSMILTLLSLMMSSAHSLSHSDRIKGAVTYLGTAMIIAYAPYYAIPCVKVPWIMLALGALYGLYYADAVAMPVHWYTCIGYDFYHDSFILLF